jgi:hypothetical protein
LETNVDADHFHDGYRYRFVGVVDTVAGAALRKIAVPADMPGWIASQLAGVALFRIQDVELGGLGDVGGYVERALTAIEKDARHE